MSDSVLRGEEHRGLPGNRLAKHQSVNAAPTPPPWVPFYLPSQGWAVCWKGPKTSSGFGPDGDLYPICHMRWTDGMRPEIEARLEAEVNLICDSVNSHAALIAAAKAALEYAHNLDERTPVDPKCRDCVEVVYHTQGTEPPPLCWIHQLERALATA